MEKVHLGDGATELRPCPRPAEARGLCSRHYMQKYRSGEMDAQVAKRPSEKLERLKFYAPPAMVSAVYRLTRATGKTMSQLLREMVGDYLRGKGIGGF